MKSILIDINFQKTDDKFYLSAFVLAIGSDSLKKLIDHIFCVTDVAKIPTINNQKFCYIFDVIRTF